MLGIDIGRGAIKLAVMNRRRRGWRLQAYAVQQVQQVSQLRESADGGAWSDNVGLREAFGAALRQLSGKSRDAAVALSCTEAVTRIIRLDAGLSDHDIENRIAVEADQHLPFKVSDALMDFCKLPASNDATVSGQDVLVVACRRDCIEQRVCWLAEFGVRPVVVDLDAMALCRMATQLPSRAPLVMLDVGVTGFRLHAFADGRLLYSRAHQVAASSLMQEIKRAVQLLLISTSCKELVCITLVGGLASLPELATNISAVCGCPARLIQPPAGITVHGRIDRAQWQTSAPQLSLACALAMRVG